MDLAASLFPLGWVLSSDLLALLILVWVAWGVPWRRLDPDVANAWMGACVLVIMLWSLSGTYKLGLSFHLLGVAALTLLMGPRLALLASALVMAAMCLDGAGSILALGLNWLTCGVVPVGVVMLALYLAQRYLPPNLFVYVFLNAFFAGGISMLAATMAGVACLGLVGAYSWSSMFDDVMPYYFLLSWPEAFTTGLMLTLLVVYKPQWVSTFDDERYLNDKMD
jgi:uncharacterized membrane protein